MTPLEKFEYFVPTLYVVSGVWFIGIVFFFDTRSFTTWSSVSQGVYILVNIWFICVSYALITYKVMDCLCPRLLKSERTVSRPGPTARVTPEEMV